MKTTKTTMKTTKTTMKTTKTTKKTTKTTKTSSISGFYKLGIDERMEIVKEFSNLNDNEIATLKGKGLGMEDADRMIENVIGTIEIPVGIAKTNISFQQWIKGDRYNEGTKINTETGKVRTGTIRGIISETGVYKGWILSK